MVVRHLASCGFAVKRQIRGDGVDHARLRPAVKAYSRAELRKSIDGRNSLGPFTDEQKHRILPARELMDVGNAA